MYRILTKEQIDKLKNLIIDNVILNPDVMHSDIILAGQCDPIPDVVDIIVGMFEYIYQISTGSEYDYLWHYANKICSWCSTDYLYQWLMREDDDDEK